MKIQMGKYTMIRSVLLAVVALSLLLFLFFAAAGIKYWSLTQKEGQVELIQDLVLEPDFVDIGQVYVAEAVFEAPWNYVPEDAPAVQESAGIQQHAEATCRRSGLSWGACRWTLLVPLQVLTPYDLKDSTVEISFSNGLTRIVKTLNIPPPEVEELEDSDWRSEENQLEMAEKFPIPPERSPWRFWILSILGILILVLVFLVLKDFFFRKKAGRIGENCWDRALREMAQLRQKVEEHKISLEFATAQLTDIIRQYLEKRFALPVSRLTTEEFLRNLEDQDSPLSGTDRKFLRSFLVAADFIKFAGVSAEPELFRQTLRQAEKLIRETRIQDPETQDTVVETEADHGI